MSAGVRMIPGSVLAQPGCWEESVATFVSPKIISKELHMQTVDKLTWKLSRVSPIETNQKLALGQDVEIKMTASVIQEIVGDNNDGTVNICYVIKPLIIELNEHD